jgi:hypothetical protein
LLAHHGGTRAISVAGFARDFERWGEDHREVPYSYKFARKFRATAETLREKLRNLVGEEAADSLADTIEDLCHLAEEDRIPTRSPTVQLHFEEFGGLLQTLTQLTGEQWKTVLTHKEDMEPSELQRLQLVQDKIAALKDTYQKIRQEARSGDAEG